MKNVVFTAVAAKKRMFETSKNSLHFLEVFKIHFLASAVAKQSIFIDPNGITMQNCECFIYPLLMHLSLEPGV